MKKNLDITKPRYSEQILPVTVSWPFVIPRFHGNCFCWIFNSMKRGFVVARAPLGGAHITLLWSGTACGKDHKDTLPQTRTHHAHTRFGAREVRSFIRQVFWYYEMVTLVWEWPDPQKLMINQIVTSDFWSKFCSSRNQPVPWRLWLCWVQQQTTTTFIFNTVTEMSLVVGSRLF